MRFSLPLLICCAVTTGPTWTSAQHLKSKPDRKSIRAQYLGAWYSTADKDHKAWLGFRLCNFSHDSKGKLLTGGGTFPSRSFALPFPSGVNVGANWQRLNRERVTCDIVLVRVSAVKATQGTCPWSVTSAGGRVIASGTAKLMPKEIKPFSPYASNLIQKGSQPHKKHR